VTAGSFPLGTVLMGSLGFAFGLTSSSPSSESFDFLGGLVFFPLPLEAVVPLLVEGELLESETTVSEVRPVEVEDRERKSSGSLLNEPNRKVEVVERSVLPVMVLGGYKDSVSAISLSGWIGEDFGDWGLVGCTFCTCCICCVELGDWVDGSMAKSAIGSGTIGECLAAAWVSL
jgi:hypothetical protein